VHVQWTGSDNVNNNGNNNAEGTDNTDRSNMVQLMNINSNIPLPDSDSDYNKHKVPPMFESVGLRARMAFLDQDQTLCKTKEQLELDHPDDKTAQEEDPRNCMKLNLVGHNYFDGGIIRINRTSTYSYHYMSTRNNNFTNRTHKASLTVLSALPTLVIVFVALGAAGMLAAVGIGAAMLCGRLQPHLNLPQMLRPQ